MKKHITIALAALITFATALGEPPQVYAHVHGHEHSPHIHNAISFVRHIDTRRGLSFLMAEGAQQTTDLPHLARFIWEDAHTGARLIYTISPNPRIPPADLLFAAEIMATNTHQPGWHVSDSTFGPTHALAISINEDETQAAFRLYLIHHGFMVSLTAQNFHPYEFDRMFQAAEQLDQSL